MAALLALPLLLAGGSSSAGPAKAPEGSQPPPGGADEIGGADMSTVAANRRKLEASMAELGELAQQAEADGDAARAACVKGWQQKGRDAMEVATGELMVIRDAQSTAQQKQFAAEKLAATTERMENIVSQARKCAGDQSPEDEDDVTTTEVDKTETVPIENPTLGGGEPPVQPPADPNVPTTVASPSM